jgi:hypothetical protein
MDTLRLAEHIHGHLGWLAAASLVHPAILLRRGRRRALVACTAATVLVTAAGIMGAAIYGSYRSTIKPILFAQAPLLGWAFERKEHMATAAIVLSWAGLAAHWANQRQGPEDARTRNIARTAYMASAVLALLSASLGVAVASYRSF